MLIDINKLYLSQNDIKLHGETNSVPKFGTNSLAYFDRQRHANPSDNALLPLK
jgi:hypothetical protein